MGDGDGVAKVKKVTVTKSDDSTVDLEIPDSDWGFTKS